MQTRVLVAVLFLCAPAAHAQVVTEMTAEATAKAIAFGYENANGGRGFAAYRLKDVSVSTPFLRIALRAADAKSKFLALDAAAITKETAAPMAVLEVKGFHESFGTISFKHMVVLVGEEIVQPTAIHETTQEWTNGLGAHVATTTGVIASFPISVLAPGNRVRVVFDNGRFGDRVLTADFLSTIQ